MLKFIDENDYLLVDKWQELSNGSVYWEYDEGGDLPTHTGFIPQGYTRTYYTVDDGGVEQEVTVEVYNRLWELNDDETSPVTIEGVDLSIIIDQAKDSIMSQRDALIYGGVEYEGNTYQTDATSIIDIMGAAVAGVDTQWLTSDNVTVPLTGTQMKALGVVVAEHKKKYVYQARVHKNNVDAMTTRDDIENYMANISWT